LAEYFAANATFATSQNGEDLGMSFCLEIRVMKLYEAMMGDEWLLG